MKVMKTEKYLNFLTELNLLLKYTDNINMHKFKRKHEVSSNVTKILIDNNIIENNGKNGRGCRWKWDKEIEPSLVMAERLIAELIRFNKRANDKKEEQKKEPKIKIKKTEIKHEGEGKFTEISILWGMFKLTFNN